MESGIAIHCIQGNTARLGTLAPTNDPTNRRLVRELIRNRLKEVADSVSEIKDCGLKFGKWWELELAVKRSGGPGGI